MSAAPAAKKERVVAPPRTPSADRSAVQSPASVHAQQQQYVDAVTNHGFDFGLTVADAFVRSIRSLGYKHCGTALDELIDNSIEAGAEHVHVAFGFEESEAKPTSIAVLDDGVGMVPDMIRAAVVWGGTHREAGRGGFGRFGYGLPSASVSQGRSFTVYSRTSPGPFQAVTLDIDDISAGKYVRGGRVVVPKARVRKLPDWVQGYATANIDDPDEVRTVVIWEKLDRLTWRTTSALERNLLQHFGVTYRNYLRTTRVVVNRNAVEPIDPLFITPGARFFELDGEHAEAIDPIKVTVKAEDGSALGTLTLRISYMSPTFFRKDKAKKATGKNANARFSVRKDHNGVVVCRLGRQIDVTTKCPYTTFVNNDRSIGLELDFLPTLDAEFGVTTAKQQITVSDRVWELLRENGFLRILESLRRRYKEESADSDTGFDFAGQDDVRPSERVMKELGSELPQARNSSDAEEALEREVTRLAKETGVPKSDIRKAKHAEAQARPFKVERESQPEAPFYRVEARGPQRVLYLNTAHRFFTDIYASVEGPKGTRLRSALELLLFAIGSCELDAEGSGRFWYASERVEWSKRLKLTLAHLEDHIDLAVDEPEVKGNELSS
jgi:hypothetical protein